MPFRELKQLRDQKVRLRFSRLRPIQGLLLLNRQHLLREEDTKLLLGLGKAFHKFHGRNILLLLKEC